MLLNSGEFPLKYKNALKKVEEVAELSCTELPCKLSSNSRCGKDSVLDVDPKDENVEM